MFWRWVLTYAVAALEQKCGMEPSLDVSQAVGEGYYATNQPQVMVVDRTMLTFTELEYDFQVVADLDLFSRDPQEFVWRSYLKSGVVKRTSGKHERPLFEVDFTGERVLKSHTATKNRSMELSELVIFNRLTLAFCDYSGIVYKIHPDGQVFQRWAIADGDGDEAKPFKTEWATVKDGRLWIGSIGFEWLSANGDILHRNAEWVKVIDERGGIRNLNWHPVYQTIRTAANATHPGFLWHEAVEWDPLTRRWIMLPRFGSTTQRYQPGHEGEGQNLLIICDEFFTDVQFVKLKNHDPRYGFTSVRKLPGSRLFVALRVREEGTLHHTQMGIFDLDGEFYTNPPFIDVGDRKFEGLAFQ
jgi:soluble calcium-activated nucleotidase 1